MGRFADWLARILGVGPIGRDSGYPTSSNGASSMHARWLGLPPAIDAVSVDLTVLERPESSDLFFWAIQASFVDGVNSMGAGHLGLQHYQLHPRSSAVNWGGYGPSGNELAGTESELPSRPGNVNTRDYSWSEGHPYRLTIDRGANGWRGSVTDIGSDRTTLVRELNAPTAHIGQVVVWSEVFARCEGPPMAVSWSKPTVFIGQRAVPITEFQLSYQTHADGGCSNTSTALSSAGDAMVQRTATERVNQAGSILRLG